MSIIKGGGAPHVQPSQSLRCPDEERLPQKHKTAEYINQ